MILFATKANGRTVITTKDNYCVYKHTFPDGKIYIGMTGRKPEERWKNGQGYNSQHTREFFNAIMQTGWDNIKHEVLETGLDRREAQRKERLYVQLFHSADQKCGYNRLLGVEKKKVKEYTNNEVEPLKRIIKAYYGGGYPCFEKMLKDFPPEYPIEGYEDVINELRKNAVEICIDKERNTIKTDLGFYVWLYTKRMFESFMFICETEGKDAAIRMMKIG